MKKRKVQAVLLGSVLAMAITGCGTIGLPFRKPTAKTVANRAVAQMKLADTVSAEADLKLDMSLSYSVYRADIKMAMAGDVDAVNDGNFKFDGDMSVDAMGESNSTDLLLYVEPVRDKFNLYGSADGENWIVSATDNNNAGGAAEFTSIFLSKVADEIIEPEFEETDSDYVITANVPASDITSLIDSEVWDSATESLGLSTTKEDLADLTVSYTTHIDKKSGTPTEYSVDLSDLGNQLEDTSNNGDILGLSLEINDLTVSVENIQFDKEAVENIVVPDEVRENAVDADSADAQETEPGLLSDLTGDGTTDTKNTTEADAESSQETVTDTPSETESTASEDTQTDSSSWTDMAFAFGDKNLALPCSISDFPGWELADFNSTTKVEPYDREYISLVKGGSYLGLGVYNTDNTSANPEDCKVVSVDFDNYSDDTGHL